MKANSSFLAAGLLFLALCAGRFASGGGKKFELGAEDKRYLDGLMKEFIFDPKGAERVSVKVTARSVWTGVEDGVADGWFVAGKDGEQGRVHFTDGTSIGAPPEGERKNIDFVAVCQARFADKSAAKGDPDEVFGRMRRNALGAVDDDDLAVAAWLYRLGQEELAAKALAAARKEKGDPRTRLRGELAWSAFAGMVHAYMVRADEEALAHGERLLRRYGKDDGEKQYGQAAKIVEDLKRRQNKGTFGKEPVKDAPDGFDAWDATKRVSYLIDALEEVDARQHGQPGGVNLGSDRRVQELIKLGEPAVPALIDALEKDERLTRSVHFWRDFARSRTVLSVREAALTALMSILRVSVFEPGSTGDNFTGRGDEAAVQMAKRLRAYWMEYGKFPFAERMMKVLTDPKTTFAAKREAADNLANINNSRQYRTMFGPTIIGGEPPPKLNPLIAKFSKPTIAEAILVAMDAELKAFRATPGNESKSSEMRRIEGSYLNALSDLGDKRIGQEIASRAGAAKSQGQRRQFAYFAHFLDQPKPFAVLADEFRQGKIKISGDEDGADELRTMISSFVDIRTPEANRALDAVADPKHPQHAAVAKKVLSESLDYDRGPWFAHPFCLAILRAGLNDITPTGGTYTIEKDRLSYRTSGGGWSGSNIPEPLIDSSVRRDRADERQCDQAAEKLSKLVVGLPSNHPLFNDAEKRLAATKNAFDRFAGNYRRANWREQEILASDRWNSVYLPDIRSLDRTATAKDVQMGKAIFHLAGNGKPVDVKLPAVAVRTSDAKKKNPPHLLVVQAEIGPDGSVVYGIITRSEIRSVPASDLTSIKSFVELDREEKDAQEKEKDKK